MYKMMTKSCHPVIFQSITTSGIQPGEHRGLSLGRKAFRRTHEVAAGTNKRCKRRQVDAELHHKQGFPSLAFFYLTQPSVHELIGVTHKLRPQTRHDDIVDSRKKDARNNGVSNNLAQHPRSGRRTLRAPRNDLFASFVLSSYTKRQNRKKQDPPHHEVNCQREC